MGLLAKKKKDKLLIFLMSNEKEKHLFHDAELICKK
jgi:hypothetical protein